MTSNPPPRYSQDYLVYTPKDQAVYLINEADWKRVKRQVSRLPAKTRRLENLSILFAGIAASSLFQVITVGAADSPPNWLIITVVCLLVISAALSLALFVLGKRQDEFTTVKVQDILDEIVGIEDRFEHHEVVGTSTDESPVEIDTRQTSERDGAHLRYREVDGSDEGRLSLRDMVYHPEFGLGTVTRLAGEGGKQKATIDFAQAGAKTLVVRFARLKKVTRGE